MKTLIMKQRFGKLTRIIYFFINFLSILGFNNDYMSTVKYYLFQYKYYCMLFFLTMVSFSVHIFSFRLLIVERFTNDMRFVVFACGICGKPDKV